MKFGEVNLIRKKPVEVKAIQWTGLNWPLVKIFCPNAIFLNDTNDSILIKTLEDGPESQAMHVASLNDWIIQGIAGEFYPCKPDIIALTYEEVEE